MLVFKPRLALFYIFALVILSLLTNRLSISPQMAVAETQTGKMINTCDATNVENSK
ncbi:hypothetical protein K2P97_09015 [bacterium]|nr:hypothetical protein [bacterium]